ncbi:MAG: hypothetical protein G01um10148_445 [Parcubacteria group bacterium Gr01-1014_8]|nr:MAG: hypothetical protein G01um10148_445 [Parcubacteria group bacterium Gr01-1014_8]
MFFDHYVAVGIVATTIGLISYIPYFRDIFRGTTKPHPFSWFAWGTITAVAFAAQIVKGGGAGTWATGITVVACYGIAALALVKGEKTISTLDWFCFAGALFGIALWIATSNPLAAVVIVCIVDLIAFVPTFAKAYRKPDEETVSTYSLGVAKWILSILALRSVNLTTALFPVVVTVLNAVFVVMVLLKRRRAA